MAGCWQLCRRTCLCCLSEEEKKTIAVDKEIKRILKQQKKKERREIKILLLGQSAPHTQPFVHLLNYRMRPLRAE